MFTSLQRLPCMPLSCLRYSVSSFRFHFGLRSLPFGYINKPARWRRARDHLCRVLDEDFFEACSAVKTLSPRLSTFDYLSIELVLAKRDGHPSLWRDVFYSLGLLWTGYLKGLSYSQTLLHTTTLRSHLASLMI